MNDEMLENVIALDEEGLGREIGFAEGFAFTDPAGERWLAMLREELAERKQRREENS